MLLNFLNRWSWVLLAAGFAVAISGDSLWIDEALTATKAREASLADWWQRMAAEKMSDLQMPLYMIFIWGCAKVFGTGEWVLRLMNLPWMVAGAAAFTRSFPQKNQTVMALAVLLSLPFAWYYLNEARPYAMQLGCALLIVAALQAMAANRSSEASRAERGWFVIFCVGLAVLGGCNMLGMIWVISAVSALGILLTVPEAMKLLGRNQVVTVATVGCLALLGGYYLWTLSVGARASAAAGTSWANVVFAGYELAGFSGLGPGRLQLREIGAPALRPYLGALTVYAALWCLVIFSSWPAQLTKLSRGRLLAIVACVLGPCCLLVAAGFLAHFRVLGRHLTPLAAVLVWLVTMSLSILWSDRALWKRVTVVGFVAVSLFSCLLLRFAPRHARDDYRGAAARALVMLQQGRTVWWSAADAGAEYYLLPAGLPPEKPGEAVELINPTAEQIRDLRPPDMVVVSKPDIHDAAGVVADYLAQAGYQPAESLSAFTIWRPPERKPGAENPKILIEQ